jgi:hypothetical protein
MTWINRVDIVMAQVLICSLSLILGSGALEILSGLAAASCVVERDSRKKQCGRSLPFFADVSGEDLTRAALAHSQEGGA